MFVLLFINFELALVLVDPPQQFFPRDCELVLRGVVEMNKPQEFVILQLWPIRFLQDAHEIMRRVSGRRAFQHHYAIIINTNDFMDVDECKMPERGGMIGECIVQTQMEVDYVENVHLDLTSLAIHTAMVFFSFLSFDFFFINHV